MFPGGLRAQLVLGLSVLLLGSVALGAVLVENVLTRRLLDSQTENSTALAIMAASIPAADRRALVDKGLVAAIVSPDERVGPQKLVDQLSESRTGLIGFDGEQYVVARTDDVTIAVHLDEIRQDVAAARMTLLLFALLVAIAVLALGYGFFGFLVVRPIRAIGVATDRAAHGDLASPIQVVPRNEFGRVATSFNEMLRQIDNNRAELEQKVAQLEAANAEIETTRDSLVRSEKLASVGQLAAGIAHEIGNPLAALSGYNELLQDPGTAPEESADLLRRSGEQLDRIREVIRNLLDFSRDESRADPEPSSLRRCVEESVSLVGAGAARRAVVFDVSELDGPDVHVVASQLIQVLVNLAMNAVDALPEGGRVRFTRSDEGGFATLSVEDDGAGVAPEIERRIFDPFFTTKEPGEGTGLGLAISIRILESFGGALDLTRSELGGARFDVRLPHSRTE